MGDVCVELFFCIFGVITFSLKLHPQTMGNGLDSLSPDSLIEFRIKSDIRSAHGLLSELYDGFHSPWSTFFE